MSQDQRPQPTRTAARLALALAAALLAACAAPHPAAPASAAPAPIVSATNRLGMRFVHVPAGEFRMGSDESAQALARALPNAERRRLLQLTDEAPVHRVRITRDFWLGETPVTVGQFQRFIRASGYVRSNRSATAPAATASTPTTTRRARAATTPSKGAIPAIHG